MLPAIAAISQNKINVDSIAEAVNEFTLLHVAAYHGNGLAVSALLKLGADPDQTDVRGQTPLHLALRSKKSNDATLDLMISRTSRQHDSFSISPYL